MRTQQPLVTSTFIPLSYTNKTSVRLSAEAIGPAPYNTRPKQLPQLSVVAFQVISLSTLHVGKFFANQKLAKNTPTGGLEPPALRYFAK